MFHLETIFTRQGNGQVTCERTLLGWNTPAGSVVENDAEVLPPVVINNVNLLLPLYGDKKESFLYLINAEDHFGNWLMRL